jgi:hypothetical protein
LRKFHRSDFLYSHALELDPTHFVLLSNRSAAFLKAGHKSKSLQDAMACVEANPKFAKGILALGCGTTELGAMAICKGNVQEIT